MFIKLNMEPLHTSSSVPSISLTSQMTIENEEDVEDIYSRGRSDSFLEKMKQSVPSPARIPSPKTHRKNHGSRSENGNHHQRHYRSPSSPILKRRQQRVVDDSEGIYLSVESIGGRPRSSSDTDVRKHKKHHMRRARSNSNISNKKQSYVHGDEGISPLASPLTSPCASPHVSPSGSPTLTRPASKVPASEIPDDTLTRRSFDVKGNIKNGEKEWTKESALNMIEALSAQCDSNIVDVESQINITFLQLATALDNRRKELLEKARTLYDQKKQTLKKSRERCLRSRRSISHQSSIDENEVKTNGYQNGTSSSKRRSSVDDQDDILQHNGILEPWKLSSEVDINEKKEVSSEPIANNEGVFSEVLEEGNLTFTFNEEVSEMFNNIGVIGNDLSSPQFSFTKGLCKSFALAGDEVYFEVHTRNTKGEVTFNNRDKLQINAVDCDGEKINVVLNTLAKNNKKGIITNTSQISHVALAHRYYAPFFVANKPGVCKIEISLNDVEIETSPIRYTIYPKMNLTFDLKTPQEKKEQVIAPLCGFIPLNNIDDRRRRSFIRRESSEDADWQDSPWVVQKGDKSTLLQSSNEMPSYIYAATVVTGLCAWKIRVNSACASITLSIGVGTRTGIPDIDEHFSCFFSVGNSDSNSSKNDGKPKTPVRRSSSFTRLSLTYAVLLNTDEGVVRVVSEMDNEDKTVSINREILEKSNLFPFCAMVHHHKNCLLQVCPRPQITLL
ncbi:uncharacterized protein LOC130656234 isoform X1 [Hydractinia symbiolongicarpus]|uniref:uncharacterized protein LOC130656234 isoform X1 n=2 Tax=Hydractinia symbiolongicarpus TaxID=13093 RepID=UPI00254AAC3B|nr:uncharacterized protein LOC130656234 isoform X1 [Hydractinia symbiolongicarpus]